MAEEGKSSPASGSRASRAEGGLKLPNPIAYFHSMPARYRIFVLAFLLSVLAFAASAALFGYNTEVFANIALFFLNVALIMLIAGLIYVLCFWAAMQPLQKWPDYLRYVALAVLAYYGGALLIGFFLYLSLTALAGALTKPDLLIFASLAMSAVLTFLARIFSSMEWKRAEDLVFSIAIYSVVVGTLFFDIQNQSGNLFVAVGSVYSQAFGSSFLYVFVIAVALELVLRKAYARWHESERKTQSG
ncbi:MAG: hypothetical protein KGH63_04825 [Candidatus Micrarchaeota archaeon]|nr:hypothetical protein [Candidatus Micrarchaeota archaeon]